MTSTPTTRAPVAALAEHFTAAAGRRWVGSGASLLGDSYVAGRVAAEDALIGPDPRLLIVFAASTHDRAALLAGVRSLAGDTPLIGCTTAGEIASDDAGDVGVVVLALGGEGFEVTTGRAEHASADLRSAGATAAACADRLTGPGSTVVLLLSDGLSGNQQDVVRGAYSSLGADVPLVGGCAGDNLRMERTWQFYDGDVLDDAVVAAAIRSDGPLGIGVQHGWQPVGEPMLVTGSDGTNVSSLDGRPALDVYLDRLDAPDEVRADPAEFIRFAQRHPLGLRRRTAEVVRYVSGADADARSLTCIAEVPEGALVWLMAGDEESVLSATDEACRDAVAALGGGPALGLVAFDCVARRAVLGDGGVSREIARIAELAGGAPVVGFYTYGEIARTRGAAGFHNQTRVVLALG